MAVHFQFKPALQMAISTKVKTRICEGGRGRPSQAFFLGWPLDQLGGVNEVVRNLIYEYASAGAIAPVVIETMDEPAEALQRGGVPVCRLSLPTPYNPKRPLKSIIGFCLRAPRLFRQLRTICERYNVQVLNPHFAGLEHLALTAFRRFGGFRGKIVLSFHGSDLRSMIGSRNPARFLYRVLLRDADVLVPCSEGLGEEILMLVPECANKIRPIANGIDSERFLAEAAEIELPEAFRNRRCILNVAAFEYKKGHNILLQAFREVRNLHTDTCLIVAGQTGRRLEETRKLIRELKLEGDVLLLQDRPHAQIVTLMQQADIFVLSSRWERGVCGEGFAMALLEAAAAGKPVVSTLTCGAAELIENGITGALVAPEQPGELAQAIHAMIADPINAEAQGRALREKVRRHFTWAKAHLQYLEACGFVTPTIADEVAAEAIRPAA